MSALFERLASGLPERHVPRRNSFASDAKSLRQWLAQLPLANPGATARLLISALREMNDTNRNWCGSPTTTARSPRASAGAASPRVTVLASSITTRSNMPGCNGSAWASSVSLTAQHGKASVSSSVVTSISSAFFFCLLAIFSDWA